MDSIGQRIKLLRVMHGLSQQELALACDISRGNLSSYENGRFNPASAAIIAIADYFDVPTDWILKGDRECIRKRPTRVVFRSRRRLWTRAWRCSRLLPHQCLQQLSVSERRIIGLFRSLCAKQQQQLLSQLIASQQQL